MSIKKTIECWASCDPGMYKPDLMFWGDEPELDAAGIYHASSGGWTFGHRHSSAKKFFSREFLTPGKCRARVTIELLDTD